MGKPYKVTTINGDVVYGMGVTSEREIIVKEWHDDKGLVHRREVGQELVRCKECRLSEVYQMDSLDTMRRFCRAFTPKIVKDDDFCSYGERKESE